MKFDRGYISPYFITDKDRLEVKYDETLVVITNQKISKVSDMVNLIRLAKGKPLLIIAEDIDSGALRYCCIK